MMKLRSVCMAGVVFFMTILAAPSLRTDVYAAEDSGTWRGKWWNYYERALQRAEHDEWETSVADLIKATELRDQDQRRARTYGMHFVDYFPHRELGVRYFNKGDFDKAIAELERSIRSESTAKAVFYLNRARQFNLIRTTGRKLPPPTIAVATPSTDFLTASGTIRVTGRASGQGYVSRVTLNGIPYHFEMASQEISFEQELTLEEGRNNIVIVAEDLLGGRTETVVPVALKREGPVIAVSEARIIQQEGRRLVRVTGEVRDPAGIASVSVGGVIEQAGATRSMLLERSIPILDVLPATVAIEAVDIVGNRTVAEMAVQPLPVDSTNDRTAQDEDEARQRAEDERQRESLAAEKVRLAEEEARQVRVAAEREAERRVAADRLALLAANEERLAREKSALEAELTRKAAEAKAVLVEANRQRAESERTKQAKIEQEKADADRRERDSSAQEQLARQKTEEARIARENAEANRLERERLERERLVLQKSEEERIAREKVAMERRERERLEQERLARQKAKEERLAQEKMDADRRLHERLEEERLARQKVDEALLAREKAEADRRGRERLEQERLARQKAEEERLASEKMEADRRVHERLEEEGLTRQKADEERLAFEKTEANRRERERLEQERVVRQKAEEALLAQEKTQADRREHEKLEKERLARQKLDEELLAREKAEADRRAQERLEQERLTRQKAEQERIRQEKVEQEQYAAKMAELERMVREKAEQERLARLRLEEERASAAKAELTRLAREQDDQERLVRERLIWQKNEAERLVLEKEKKERLERERIAFGENGKKKSQEKERHHRKQPTDNKPSRPAGPDHEPPIIVLKEGDEPQAVFGIDTYAIQGYASDNSQVKSVRIGGSDLSLPTGQKIYFSKTVKLREGENKIKVEAMDQAGNRSVKEIIVVKSVPSVMQTSSRTSMLVLPHDTGGREAGAVSPVLDDYLSGEFIKQKRFKMVERKKVRQVLDEQKFSSAMSDPEQAIKIGNLAAADMVVAGTVREDSKSVELFLRVINSETGEQMAQADAYIEDKRRESIQQLVESIVSKVAENFPVVEGLVIERDSDEVMANVGSLSRVKQSMGVIFFRKGSEIKDPVTGKVIGVKTVQLGEGRFSDVQQGFSKVILSGKAAKGDITVKDMFVTK